MVVLCWSVGAYGQTRIYIPKDSVIAVEKTIVSTSENLRKHIYGWHPHWMERENYGYDYSLLTTLSYFSYEINEKTGRVKNEDKFDWKESRVIDSAKLHGCRVELTASLFGNQKIKKFLASPTARQNFINDVIWLLKLRNGDGLCLDFELMPKSESANYVNFVAQLNSSLKAAIPHATLTMALPAVDWNGAFDIAALNPYIDFFIMMGYDYYYAGSPSAGPTAPLYSHPDWGKNSLKKSIHTFQSKGLPMDKFIIGLPYYGRKYLTMSDSFQSTKIDYIGSLTYAKALDEVMPEHPATFDNRSHTFYSMYKTDSGWHQYWFETEYSLEPKFDLAYEHDAAGIGIWALGYDRGHTGIWELLDRKFARDGICDCEGSIYDIGGKSGDYQNNQFYQFTLRSPNGSRMKIDFEEIGLETGADFLEVYDGADTNAKKIATLTGWLVVMPELLSSTDALTFVFSSNEEIAASGFGFNWQCLTNEKPEIPPVAVEQFMPEKERIPIPVQHAPGEAVKIKGKEKRELEVESKQEKKTDAEDKESPTRKLQFDHLFESP